MSIDFVFFYIDTETNELSNKHKSLDRDDIIYFIKSIKKYHPESKIIHCTDLFTKSFSDVDLVHRVKFDTNFGAGEGIRTLDFNLCKVAMYN